MPIIHYLNVGNGDCSIIEHVSGRVTMIDVNLAKIESQTERLSRIIDEAIQKANYNQKAYPENPIEYLKNHSIKSIFRFILTHPDDDHFGGIESLFNEFKPTNFWDISNNKTGETDDWKFYKNLKEGSASTNAKRLLLLRDASAVFYNQDSSGGNGDGLYILSPTQKLVDDANETEDYNMASYVILYKTHGLKILFCGDADDLTWEDLIENKKSDISDIDLLIAPHHGRKTKDGNYTFLDILKPKMTLFGNGESENMAYDAWNYRKLRHITNNEAGSIISNISQNTLDIYVTNEKFAKDNNQHTFYSEALKGWFLTRITR